VKKYLLFYSAVILLTLLISVVHASEKIRVGVFDLEPSNVPKETAVTVSELLRAELFSTGRFITVDKKNMDKILKEQAFQQTGCTSSECAVEVGKILNVNIMATGSLNKLGNIYNIAVTLTDVERGETLQIEKDSCDSEEKLAAIIKSIAGNIAFKMPIIGKVVRVSADGINVVVDLGTVDRVEKTMRFKVNRLKEEIKDSTGKVIMKEFEDIGEIVLTDVQTDASKAEFIRKNDSKIKTGDNVKIGEEDLKRMNSGYQAPRQFTGSIAATGTTGGSPFDSAWRSLILPGWGQFYNKDDLKGWVFTIAGLSAAGITVAKYFDFDKKRKSYENATDSTLMDALYNDANNAYHEFNGAAKITALVWALNLVDAVLSYDSRKQHSSIVAPESAPKGLYCKSNYLDSVTLGYNLNGS